MNDADARPILVVDDDRDIREMLEMVLVASGYSVVTVPDGRACLEWLRTDAGRPMLVLLDLMMPDLNGWEVCAELADDAGLSAIPVVILTGNAQLKDAQSFGRPILRKPIQLDTLVAAVERYAA